MRRCPWTEANVVQESRLRFLGRSFDRAAHVESENRRVDLTQHRLDARTNPVIAKEQQLQKVADEPGVVAKHAMRGRARKLGTFVSSKLAGEFERSLVAEPT